MSQPLVTTERRDDGVAVLRLDNPKVNALSSEMLRQIEAAAGELSADPPGAVVVSGGDRLFAAGADISEFAGPDEARRIGGLFLSALNAVAAIPRVTIAAVSGFALGGGCELALACDFRLASSRALILSGRQVGADEALAMGLADRVVEPEALLDEALGWAASFARGAVVAQGIAKAAIDSGLETDLDAGLRIEQDRFVEVFGTDDARIGVESFLENGPGHARFTGR